MSSLAMGGGSVTMVGMDAGAMGEPSQPKVWRAVILSLALHALVVILYPHLNRISLPEIPERLEIEFFTMKAAAPAPAMQAQPTPVPPMTQPPQETPKLVTPQPVKPTKPVLAAPAADADYKVQEQPQPAKAEPAPVTAPPVTPAQSAPSAPASNPAASAASSDNHPSTEQSKEARPATNAPVSESDELTAGDNDAWGDYGEQLRTLVNKSKQYPTIAIRRHLEGDVTVVAHFVRGELTQVTLAESSKHASLDEETLRMVKKAIGQLGVKESLKKKTFKITIPVSFKLE